MEEQKSRTVTRYEYEKVAAYSLLLSEALFAILKGKGLLTHGEVNRHMEKLHRELICRSSGIEFSKEGSN